MPTNAWTQEIRFATVFFGGVSLAIYMNGVAQELFRMVRSTADLDVEKLDAVEKIYRELGQILYLGREVGKEAPAPQENDPVRTRFVVDILSGTSAGGINAVALAKALALRLPSISALTKTWLEDADLDTLLNDKSSDLRTYPNPSGRTASLLNSERMYATIHKTLADMNAGVPSADGHAGFADEIDLFVTATDLNGLWTPLRLADKTINERMHKTAFRFRYSDFGPGTMNDFKAEFDPMLAFAARCTSSFPAAFEPMTLERIEKTLDRNNLGSFQEAKCRFERFFPNYLRIADGQNEPGFHQRLFADGGYLDNKPFSYAIDLIRYRAAERPVQRKLLYIDPFPEIPTERPFRPDITFFENAQLAAMGLPRYETIRADIEAINASNRLQDRLDSLRERVEDSSDPRSLPQFEPDGKLSESIAQFGNAYASYHNLRVSQLTDALAVTITRVAQFNEDSDQFFFIRAISRAWRENTYHRGKMEGKDSENQLLYKFDFSFRLRRLNHLAWHIDGALERELRETKGQITENERYRSLAEARLDVERELVFLRRRGGALCSPRRSPLRDSINRLRSRISDQDFEDVVGAPTRQARDKAANDIYERHKAFILPIIEVLREELSEIFEKYGREKRFEHWPIPIRKEFFERYFQHFVHHDMLSVPFLAGSGVHEYTRTEVYRIGPTDAGLYAHKVPQEQKLASTKFFDFGGFISREWRENDIMWGRLDAADRIVTAVLPCPEDKKLRDRYVKRLQDAILEDEISINKNDRISRWLIERLRRPGLRMSEQQLLSAARQLITSGPMQDGQLPGAGTLVSTGRYREFIESHYDLPPGPGPDTLSGLIGRGLTIMGKMVDEDLVPQEKRDSALGRSLRTLGGTATKVARFSIPNTLRQRIVRDWLGVLALSGVPIALAGIAFGRPDLTSFGAVVVVVFLLLVLVQQGVGVGLSGTQPLRRLLRIPAFVIAAIVVGLIIFGAVETLSLIQSLLPNRGAIGSL